MIELLICLMIGTIMSVLIMADKIVKLKQDAQEKINDNFEFIKEKLKCKKLYKVNVYFEQGKKCKYCDENRMVTLTYPDGTTKKEPCVCKNNNKKVFTISEYGLKDRKEYGFSYTNKGRVVIHLYDEDWTYKVIRNQKDYDALLNRKSRIWISSDILFANKKLAQQFMKHLKGDKK